MADLSLRLVDWTHVSLPAFLFCFHLVVSKLACWASYLFSLNCEQLGLLGILILVFLTILLFAALVGGEIWCVTDNLKYYEGDGDDL